MHTHKAKAGVLGRTAAWTHRVPATVHTFHGHLLTGYFSPAKTRVGGERRAHVRRAARPAWSPSAARCATSCSRPGSGAAPSTSWCRPAPASRRCPAATTPGAASRLPLDAPVVTFVGRLTGVKRPERFVDAAIRLAATRPTAHFLVAGEGELLDSLRERALPARGPDPVPRVVRRRRAGLRRQRRGDAHVRQRGDAGLVDRSGRGRDPGGHHPGRERAGGGARRRDRPRDQHRRRRTGRRRRPAARRRSSCGNASATRRDNAPRSGSARAGSSTTSPDLYEQVVAR